MKKELSELLEELRDYLEPKADADNGKGNIEMSLLFRIETFQEKYPETV